MSLPDYKSPGKQPSPAAQQHSPVVQLNVGGHIYCTTLGTLKKFPNSKLADMFNGPPKLRSDAEGRYFVDRDGTHFGQVLEYLRVQRAPTDHLQEVYREAVFYDIRPLVKLIEETPRFFGETVGRQQFLSRVPHYQENLEVIIRVARAEAIAARHSTIVVCVLRSEEDLARYNDAVSGLIAERESMVSFGPWKGTPTAVDLLDSIKMDIEAKGYKVSFQPYSVEKGFLFKSYDFFFKLTFTWW
ncbi:BTB/POZ domain-containing protein KCTD14 isoform X2 [Denticeps clupeoides]|uniref:BTB/POZ domain-containing protein KCTD14 isoform X2 n=1 Tax=Denticeps clupeoides TaxID=299321 RepID=UPI0010A56BC6|nr:BTB/POZ domain-containing protein KCTD14 isoform X2 [Denticeps clupeoides]